MKKHLFYKGKTFYSILGILILFSYLPILVALVLSLRTLDYSRTTLNSMLDATQQTQMSYSQSANPGRNHMDQLSSLREYPLLKELGEASYLEYGPNLERAQNILLSVTPAHSDSGQITTYLYFPKSRYLLDSSATGQNAIQAADPMIFSGLGSIDSTCANIPRAFMYTAKEDGKTHTFYTATVFPNVIFIFDIYFSEYPSNSRNDISIAEELTASLLDVELCYYDSYGNIRPTSGTPELMYLYDYYSLGPDSNHSFSFTHNGHHYLCHYVFNEYNMTKFALFCRDEIAEEQQRTTSLLCVSGGVLLLTFLACAVLYTHKAYKPIDSLIARLDKAGENPSPGSLKKEFDVLADAINSFEHRLNKQNQLLRDHYLLRTLRGQNTNTLEDYKSDLLSDQDGYSFAVAALRTDESLDDTFYNNAQLEPTVIGFLNATGFDTCTVSDTDFLYIVLRLPNTVRSIDLRVLFHRLQQQLDTCYISVYLSNIHSCAHELRRCYNEAMAVSEYYIANEKVNIIADMSSTPDTAFTNNTPLNFGRLSKLSDCITTLAIDEAVKTFEELTFQFVQSSRQSLTPDSPMYNLLANTISLAFYDIDLPNETKTQIQQWTALIRSSDSIGTLRQHLCEGLTALAKRSEGQEYYQLRFEKVRDYIQEHYTDPNLDSASIAEHFKMSPSAITRLFNRCNNSGFLEYVHQTRVQKATELLRTTDLPIFEIAALVGYTNAATMNRAFKAHAKSTPSMIRKRAQDS